MQLICYALFQAGSLQFEHSTFLKLGCFCSDPSGLVVNQKLYLFGMLFSSTPPALVNTSDIGGGDVYGFKANKRQGQMATKGN